VRVLVATDVAARGVHVDDVELVVHVDPPMEHKAYLHRSGRTARAGAEGVVVTVALDAQRRDVTDLLKKAGIAAPLERVEPNGTEVSTLVGEPAAHVTPAPVTASSQGGGQGGRSGGASRAGSGGGNGGRSGGGRGQGGRGGSGQGEQRSAASVGGERSGSGSRRRGSGQGQDGSGRSAQGAPRAAAQPARRPTTGATVADIRRSAGPRRARG
jgi:superfamily II DNA/RNA helicase